MSCIYSDDGRTNINCQISVNDAKLRFLFEEEKRTLCETNINFPLTILGRRNKSYQSKPIWANKLQIKEKLCA